MLILFNCTEYLLSDMLGLPRSELAPPSYLKRTAAGRPNGPAAAVRQVSLYTNFMSALALRRAVSWLSRTSRKNGLKNIVPIMICATLAICGQF